MSSAPISGHSSRASKSRFVIGLICDRAEQTLNPETLKSETLEEGTQTVGRRLKKPSYDRVENFGGEVASEPTTASNLKKKLSFIDGTIYKFV